MQMEKKFLWDCFMTTHFNSTAWNYMDLKNFSVHHTSSRSPEKENAGEQLLCSIYFVKVLLNLKKKDFAKNIFAEFIFAILPQNCQIKFCKFFR